MSYCIVLCRAPYSTVQVPYSDYVLYGTMQCLYYMLYYYTTLCCTMLNVVSHYSVLFFTFLYGTIIWYIPHCAIYPLCYYLCHIDLYCAVVYSIVLYSTVQYCSVLCQMADSVYPCDVLHYAVPY